MDNRREFLKMAAAGAAAAALPGVCPGAKEQRKGRPAAGSDGAAAVAGVQSAGDVHNAKQRRLGGR
jgi:hypothetical protein